MSVPGTFKKLFAVAGGATAAFLAVSYTGELYKMNYQIDEADALAIRKINTGYAELQKDKHCNSLLKKNLTPTVLQKLENKKTKLGASLYDIIRSGLHNHDLAIGVYAADPESYHKFALLFDKILEDYHGFKPGAKQPLVDLGEEKINEFPSLDPTGKYVKSIRIRCARSIAGYPFNPLLSADDYMILEQKVKNALLQIEEPELRGVYYSLDRMPKKTQDELDSKQLLFNNNSSLLKHANAYNVWPEGRGIFHNNDKSFLVWVNEEDHISMISVEEGSDVDKALARLIRGLKALERKLTFARDIRLGWLTSNPSSLGSAINASAEIFLPKLSKKSDFVEICEKLNLRVSSASINSSGVPNGYYFISNKISLGLTQYEAVKQMYDGIKELIQMEEQL
ncbi:arginine kinase [Loa loa]|uniref:arginine kinase n=1 Tax=Loa loa TaxID=7209 RepID=A0A1I7VYV8_LOALO|nr:arginine kinase [Loa loa]EJD74263.1 arginine kinase [Loa loa]